MNTYISDNLTALYGGGWSTTAITLGYAEITSPGVLITANGTVTDVAGLSVTVTVPAGGRRIKITGYCSSFYNDAVGVHDIFFIIREDSTVLALNYETISYANTGVSTIAIASFVPTAGNHTYKISAQQNSANNMRLAYEADTKAFILCELI